MSESIKIQVEPEVKLDPTVFASFQNAGVRAASMVVAATNRASKAQQTLGMNIQHTGVLALGAATQVANAQMIMTNATQAGTARRIQAIQNQIQAVNQLAQATQALNQAAGQSPQINITRGGRSAGTGGNGMPPTNQLMLGNQMYGALRQGTSNVLGIGREVGRGMGFDLDVSNSMQRNLNINREATQLAIQGQSPDVKGTANDIETQARGIALQTGANVEDIIKGLRAFHAYTGDLKGGMDQLRNMSQSSVAFDTPMQDMASLYAVITKYMGNDATKEGVDALVRSLGTQGRMGAVELKDQIKQDPKILVNAQNFGVSDTSLKAYGGNKKAAQAGIALGLQQALMGVSAESAQQTGNAVKSFTDTITQKNAQEGFKKHGIDVFTKDKETGKKILKPLEELIPLAVGVAMKDPTIMRELMPNVRGRKAIQGLSGDARVAYDESLKAGKSEDQAELAAAAVALNQLRQAAYNFQTDAERMGDVSNFLASEAGQAAQAQAQIRETMDQATKAIILSVNKNLPDIESSIKGFAGVIGSAAEHPKTALAVAFAAPAVTQAIVNAAAAALPSAFAAVAPILAGAAAAAGPLIVGAIVAASVAALILALVPEKDPDTGEQGTEGGSGSTAEEKAAEARESSRNVEEAWAHRFDVPPAESEGFTGANPSPQNPVTVDFNYEKMKQAMSDALRDNPSDTPFPNSPSRQDGVVVE